jgi:hypothetical protein
MVMMRNKKEEIQMEKAKELAEKLFDIDAENESVNSSGEKAYDGWLRSSGQAGDLSLCQELKEVNKNDFAMAWEELYEEEFSDEMNGRR